MEILMIDSIPVEVIRKRIKNLNLRVCPPDGKVQVSVPLHTSPAKIQAFIKQKQGWIEKHRQRMQSRQPEVTPLSYETDDTLFLWGKPYLLQLEIGTGKKKEVLLEENRLILRLPEKGSAAYREGVLKEWLRVQIKQEIPALLEKWEPVLGVQAAQWGVKEMRTRWGTCNTREKRIWLNLRLAGKPRHCLEYVVVHELVHLLERNHSARFWAYLDRYLPSWPEIRKQLNQVNTF